MKRAAKSKPVVRPADDLMRLPGLFRRWEFEQVIQIGSEFVVDEAGAAADGSRL